MVIEDSSKLQTAAKILKFLGNETRLNLLRLLMYNNNKYSVSELAAFLKLSESNVRIQILKLKDSGLVNQYKGGNETIFSINRESDYLDFVVKVLEVLPWPEAPSQIVDVDQEEGTI